MNHWKYFLILIGFLVCSAAARAALPQEKVFTNTVGMTLVRIEPGKCKMGFEGSPLSAELLEDKGSFRNGDLDEHPSHPVWISKPFYMGAFEVANWQYELFDPSHKNFRGKAGATRDDDEPVTHVNWHQAQTFCQWLSDKEGQPYRLPTEAEWEYACRAGTTTVFNTGDALPRESGRKRGSSLKVGAMPPNAWGLFDMHGNVEEWCQDWYGPYEAGSQTDPVGRADGIFRVTRGGSHSTLPYYLRSANRMGTIPEDRHGLIGFRVVLAPMPASKPSPAVKERFQPEGVSRKIPADLLKRPDPGKPFFQDPRVFVKIPPGSHGPLFSRHNHFISVTDCPNGDLLAIFHTCETESGRELAVAGSRLRYGTTEWQPATIFWDAPDRNDHGHALWFDGDKTVYYFQGLATVSREVAIVLRTSTDSGVTWSRPRLITQHNPVAGSMPVESVFRTKEGYLALACDKGGSVIWLSKNGGLSWETPGGKIAGIHETVAQLNDGRLLAFGRGGEEAGMMPMSISSDLGKSWQYSPSEFQPVELGQRCVLLRLKEGPLFFASFCKRMKVANASGKQHEVSGLFAAVSMDEGKTWPRRRLVTDDGPGREIETMNGFPITLDAHHSESAAYITVCQSPNGIINLLSSRQHYAFNLKWLTTLPPAAPEIAPAPAARALPVKKVLAKEVTNASATAKAESDFPGVNSKNGFTVEFKVRVSQAAPKDHGFDLECYDGAASRYAVSVTDHGVYWYEGLLVGTATLPFNQYTPVVADLENGDRMHTYRLAVRGDRIVQIYRDGELLGARRAEYRTPRTAYLSWTVGKQAEAQFEHIAYDTEGAFQP